MEQVNTNQPQGPEEQLPDLTDPQCLPGFSPELGLPVPPLPPNPTCGNITAIELLTTASADQIFQKYLRTFSPATLDNNGKNINPNMVFSAPAGGAINITGPGQQINIDLVGFLTHRAQPQFSVLTERFDATNHVISVVTLKGHPLAGWRYWRVYSIGTNDVVIEIGAYDQPGPTLKNYVGYFLAHRTAVHCWYYFLKFIQNDLQASQGASLNGTFGGIQAPANYYLNPDSISGGFYDYNGVFTGYILNNICQSTSCN